ncbi:hypothetical protein [Lyngbya sp. CCY1209]|uniref:hypothetical protein n=1 Tax=Lyngbya sp. CCY1209 TaxID=2886103 RepID=UPI002D202E14|nr:hypothetical protein [Lyngbya sp. CCY1209]MEB3883862.1 hypothetical protein [Lyngbya sp. CCY1209]
MFWDAQKSGYWAWLSGPDGGDRFRMKNGGFLKGRDEQEDGLISSFLPPTFRSL